MKEKSLGGYLIVLFFLSFLLSCGNKHKQEITSLVEYWMGKEIVLPITSVFIQDKDTVDFSLEAPYKVLSYVDSTGCVGCKLKLPEWKKFLDVLHTSNPSVKVLFFFSPGKMKDVYNALNQSYFNYPICIDLKDSLNQLNHFSSNMSFQTFLLDDNNKVVAIGNPIHNPNVKELYLRIVRGEKVEKMKDDKAIKTEVATDKASISLGNFDWQKEQKVIFTLKNIGDKPLIIQDVNTSCGCTSVNYSKEPIQPHGEIDLEVVYKADHPEHFSKTITVYCNTESSPIKLSISGNAE